jgi:O-methyltransferase
MKSKIKWLSRVLGYGILRRVRNYEMFLPDMTEEDLRIIREVRPFTMTSPEKIFGLVNAVRYVIKNNIPGDMVECGVWKGGSVMAAAKALLGIGVKDRFFHLYDTFAGMTPPTKEDVTSYEPRTADKSYELHKAGGGVCRWAYAPLEEAKRNIFSTGYPEDKVRFVVGPVEETLPSQVPERICLLRLDTDFYKSTLVEMEHLFPRLSSGGVIIVDDYGHWQGARQAIDEYLAQHKVKLLLNRLDYSGRIGVKI